MKKFNPIAELFRSLGISVALMFIGFALGQRFIPQEVVLMANMLVMGMLIFLIILALFTRFKKKKGKAFKLKLGFVYLFTFVEGILIYPILQFYIADLGASIVTNVLLGIILFLVVAYMIAKKVDYSKLEPLGSILFVSLLVLLVLSIIGIFFVSEMFLLLITVAGILIFGLFTIYDLAEFLEAVEAGKIKEKDDLSFYVLNIFLDIVNLLLDILRLIWIFKN